MIDLAQVLPAAVAAVEAEGARLLEEFHRPEGPRGARASAPIDTEMEERLCAALQAIVPCTFGGEETGTTPGTLPGYAWLVDPQDGTSEFISGKRGSAVAVALLRGSEAVLGIVHSPNAPDRGHDTIAWAAHLPHLLRNGAPVNVDLSRKRLEAGELCFATASTAQRPEGFSRAFAPARYVAMPSIAYRLARVAAGDGVATLSIHPVNEYDIAAGLALVRAAKGVVRDAEGKEIVLQGSAEARVTGCYAGAPHATDHLLGVDWKAIEREPRQPARVALGYPRKNLGARLSRASGCLAGMVIGDLAQGRDAPSERVEEAVVFSRSLLSGQAESGRDLLHALALGLRHAGAPHRAAAAAEGECARLAAAVALAVGGGDAGPLSEFASSDPVLAQALLGAARGREAFPPRALLEVMACRPLSRPRERWPDDVLELAEALLLRSRT